MRVRRLTISLWLGVIALSATVLPVEAQRGRLRGLDKYIQESMAVWEVPGLALSVVKDGEIIHASGYGVRELGKPEKVDEHTLFAIGSASKAFTTASIAMLIDEDKLEWDDKATKYLPEFELFDPYVTRELTVRDLLCHRSGLSRGDFLWYSGRFSRDEVLHRVRYLEPSWSFRSQFGYQNMMFLAAGEVVEAISGVTWDEFVRQRIFGSLGMTASNSSVTELKGRDDVATPHAEIDDEVVPVAWRNIDNVAPAGSINSNVVDMAQWVRLQLGEGKYGDQRLISSGEVKEMHTPQTVIRSEGIWAAMNPESNFLTYGLGWFLMDYRGHKVVQHGGNIDGMSALVAMIPDEQLGLVVLTNMNGTLLTMAVMYRVFDMMLGHPEKDWSAEMRKAFEGLVKQQEEAEKKVEESRVAGTSPSLTLEDYAGMYADSMYGKVEVALEDGSLVVSYGNTFMGDLTHWHYDTFRATWRDRILGKSMLRFSLNNEGKVSELNVQNIGDFERVPEEADTTAAVTLSEEQLRRFVAEYVLESPPVEMSVELVGSALKLTVPGQPTYTLIPLTESRFRIGGAPPGFFVEFAVTGGRVTGLTVEQPNITLQLERKKG